MTLPFTEVVAAARSAGNRAGTISALTLSRALAGAVPVDDATAALHLARVAAGASVDTLTVRELELEIGALPREARSLARVVAPTLVQHESGAVVQRALVGIVGAMSAVFGALVPWAVAVDATILQACRECGFGRERLNEKDRANELARRLAHALSVPVIGSKGPETPEVSAKKLAALDAVASAIDSRRKAIEKQIRDRLPKV